MVRPADPRFRLEAAAEFRVEPAVPEFRIICNAAKQHGIDAVHGTLSDLSYDGSRLKLSNEPVHLWD